MSGKRFGRRVGPYSRRSDDTGCEHGFECCERRAKERERQASTRVRIVSISPNGRMSTMQVERTKQNSRKDYAQHDRRQTLQLGQACPYPADPGPGKEDDKEGGRCADNLVSCDADEVERGI
jgi:hypothetical protein